jgi:hypothetical protein
VVRVKLNARIENYRNEANKCAEVWEKKRVGTDYPEQVIVGMYSGIQHIREASYTVPAISCGGPGVTLKGDCSGCSTLDRAVKAMHRDKVIYEARDFQ